MNDRGRFLLALAVSLAAHGMMLLRSGGEMPVNPHRHGMQMAMHIHFVRLAHADTPRIAPVQKPAPMPVPEPVPKPVVHPLHRHVRSVKYKNQIPPETRPALPRPLPAPKPPKVVADVPADVASPAVRHGMRESERQHYLARLLEHIARYKHYPRAARRRGIEGDVRVSFLLAEDGTVRNIHIDSGFGVLRNAALHALRQAQPLPVPPPAWGKEPLKFTMRFHLQ